MKKVLLALLLAVGVYAWYDRPAVTTPVAIPAQPVFIIDEHASYISVYGRQSCQFTRTMLTNLEVAKLDYRFFDLNEPAVVQALHAHMRRKGVSPDYYLLPVVDVRGKVLTRPDFAEVSQRYRGSLAGH